MLRTLFHTGLIAAGIALVAPVMARASGPSDSCRDGASQCRDAFAKLEACQQGSSKKEAKAKDTAKEAAPAKEAAAEKSPKEETKTAKDDDACAAERSATDAACKPANSACVKDGSRHAPHARKG